MRVRLPQGVEILVINPIYFVATKIVAFLEPQRGRGDFRASHDLEDVIIVLRGVDGLLDEVAAGRDPVHDYVRRSIRDLLGDPRLLDALPGHFEPDAATQATVEPFVAELRRAVTAAR